MVPVLLELGGYDLGLVLVAEVSKVIVHKWASPALPDLLVLPKPGHTREEGGILFRTGPPLSGEGQVNKMVCSIE